MDLGTLGLLELQLGIMWKAHSHKAWLVFEPRISEPNLSQTLLPLSYLNVFVVVVSIQ